MTTSDGGRPPRRATTWQDVSLLGIAAAFVLVLGLLILVCTGRLP